MYNKKQLKLIEGAAPYVENTPFDVLHIITCGELYRGFWGKNGYNKIVLVCEDTKEKKKYILGDKYQCDVLQIWHDIPHMNIDIPKETNTIRLWPIEHKKRMVFEVINLSSLELKFI